MGSLGRSPQRLARLLLCIAALTAPLALLITASPSSAGGTQNDFQVQVGYADTYRPLAVNFPTPWAGDPGVVYDGCDPSTCVWDGGAIRIVNTSGGTLTIDSVQVVMGGGPSPCVLDMWQHDRSLPAGDSLILAQQTSGIGFGCNNPPGNFDSSDMGIDGSSWDGQCTISGLTPEVDVTIQDPQTGQPVTTPWMDTGHVLNTGGFDLGDCPRETNESSQWWIPIGQASSSAFVVSDNDTLTAGSPVTFWGSQWANANGLQSSGLAGFKGFAYELTPSTTCGSTWVASPGNSETPPAAPLGEAIPVIVTGPITRTNTGYEGTIEHILVVSTNPGYAPNPGHAGAGDVVSQVC